ncbi:hypothetical protein Asch01_01069 [Acinetobacter schindleri]
MNTTQKNNTTKIAIIGAGFGGIAMAIRLQQQGMTDFIILEKSNDFGGTWCENQYPGTACDVQSHMYSLSYAPKADSGQKDMRKRRKSLPIFNNWSKNSMFLHLPV